MSTELSKKILIKHSVIFKFAIRTVVNGNNLAIKIVPISNEQKEDKVTDYFDLLLGLSSDLSPKGIFVSQVYAVFPHCSSVLFGKLGKNHNEFFEIFLLKFWFYH